MLRLIIKQANWCIIGSMFGFSIGFVIKVYLIDIEFEFYHYIVVLVLLYFFYAGVYLKQVKLAIKNILKDD